MNISQTGKGIKEINEKILIQIGIKTLAQKELVTE